MHMAMARLMMGSIFGTMNSINWITTSTTYNHINHIYKLVCPAHVCYIHMSVTNDMFHMFDCWLLNKRCTFMLFSMKAQKHINCARNTRIVDMQVFCFEYYVFFAWQHIEGIKFQ